MDARVVWQVWRRIMRDTDLQAALFSPRDIGQEPDLRSFGFSDAERKAALAYAAEGDRVQWSVVNYRYRLTHSFVNALETGAPLVLRALLGKGLDPVQLGAAFLKEHDWRDYGPYVYTCCSEALQFLSEDQATAAPTGLRALIGFEQTAVEMLLGLRTRPRTGANSRLLSQTAAARLYSCNVRLSEWLRDRTQLGKSDLEHGEEHYLLYFQDTVSLPRSALVPQRAAEIYQALATPCTRSQLPDALAALGYAASTDRDDDYLRVLGNYHAVFLPDKA
jgi:hypothetical protein